MRTSWYEIEPSKLNDKKQGQNPFILASTLYTVHQEVLSIQIQHLSFFNPYFFKSSPPQSLCPSLTTISSHSWDKSIHSILSHLLPFTSKLTGISKLTARVQPIGPQRSSAFTIGYCWETVRKTPDPSSRIPSCWLTTFLSHTVLPRERVLSREDLQTFNHGFQDFIIWLFSNQRPNMETAKGPNPHHFL